MEKSGTDNGKADVSSWFWQGVEDLKGHYLAVVFFALSITVCMWMSLGNTSSQK
jgi:hypothetical protein